MGTITGRYHYNPLKTARGVAKTRLTVEQEDHSGPVSPPETLLPIKCMANTGIVRLYNLKTFLVGG